MRLRDSLFVTSTSKQKEQTRSPGNKLRSSWKVEAWGGTNLSSSSDSMYAMCCRPDPILTVRDEMIVNSPSLIDTMIKRVSFVLASAYASISSCDMAIPELADIVRCRDQSEMRLSIAKRGNKQQ